MKPSEKTQALLDDLASFVVQTNKGDQRRWGVLFDTVKLPDGSLMDEIYASAKPPTAQHVTILVRINDWGELEYNRERPFFSYDKNEFTSSPYEKPTQYLRDRVESIRMFTDMFEVPWINLMEWMNMIVPEIERKQRSRLVIQANKGGVKSREHVICMFNKEGVFVPPAAANMTRVFIVDKYSKIQLEDIDPELPYECRIVDKDDTAYYVNVLGIYIKGVEMAVVESGPMGFRSDTIKEVHDFLSYPPGAILQIPQTRREPYTFPPIHLELFPLFEALTILRNFETLEFHVNNDFAFGFVMIRGKRPGPDYPNIEIYIGTLDQRISMAPC